MATDGRMDKDVVDIYNGILLSHKTMPFAATWIYLEIVILSEVRQRKINTWYCLYVESKKKKWYKGTCLWNRNRVKEVENKLMVTKGEREEPGRL